MLVKGPLITPPHDRQISYISRTLVCNEIVYRSDLVRSSPVGAARTLSSFSI